jgi:hypothetical protein
MNISFAYTSPPLLAGRKRRTNRDWSADYAQRFHAGDRVTASNHSFRVGGFHIADIKLTADPVLESMLDMTDQDYEDEGLAYLAEHPEVAAMWGLSPEQVSFEAFCRWRLSDYDMWVVRFDLIVAHYQPDAPCLVPKRLSKAASVPWLRRGAGGNE